MPKRNDDRLKNFDDLFTGSPVDIEKNLSALIPEAQTLKDKSIYIQILSQIALAQAMQEKFQQAHGTLDLAEKNLTTDYPLAHVRVLLERGRVFHQADNSAAALPLFQQSYSLSNQFGFDFHTINAAHMIAIVIPDVTDKIVWNNKAISLAKKTQDNRAQAWLGALYNNLAQNYIEAEQYDLALSAFQECKKCGTTKENPIIVRGANWGIGRALRSLNQLDEALSIQLQLLNDYKDLVQDSEYPLELISMGRGLVYEELAEIYLAYTKKYAILAYEDLSPHPWNVRLIPKRIARMKYIKELRP